jgi:hypothetical protein
MTASEVINEIKAMSAQEREKVAAFLLKYEEAKAIHYADDQAVKEASERILKDHAKLMRKLAS